MQSASTSIVRTTSALHGTASRFGGCDVLHATQQRDGALSLATRGACPRVGGSTASPPLHLYRRVESNHDFEVSVRLAQPSATAYSGAGLLLSTEDGHEWLSFQQLHASYIDLTIGSSSSQHDPSVREDAFADHTSTTAKGSGVWMRLTRHDAHLLRQLAALNSRTVAHLATCGCRCSSLVVLPPCTRRCTCRLSHSTGGSSVSAVRLDSFHLSTKPASHSSSLDRTANTVRPSTILVARRCLRRPVTRIRSDERSSTAATLDNVYPPPSASQLHE